LGRHYTAASHMEVLYAGEEEKRRFAGELVRRTTGALNTRQ